MFAFQARENGAYVDDYKVAIAVLLNGSDLRYLLGCTFDTEASEKKKLRLV